MCDQPGQAKGKHAVLFLRGKKTVVSYILLLPYKGEHFNILYLPNREENLKATMMILLIKRRKVNQVISEKAS